MTIEIQKYQFKFIAYYLPFTDSYDMIIGIKSMVELEAKLDCQKGRFTYLQYSMALVVDKHYIIPPKKSAVIEARMMDKPYDLHNGIAVCKINTSTTGDIWQATTVKTEVRNG